MSLELERFLNLLEMLVLNRGGGAAQAPRSPARALASSVGESLPGAPGAVASPTKADTGRMPDAIDAELAAPARVTGVVSLREAPEIQAFRQELIDGLIRTDTVNQLLHLANTVISRLLA